MSILVQFYLEIFRSLFILGRLSTCDFRDSIFFFFKFYRFCQNITNSLNIRSLALSTCRLSCFYFCAQELLKFGFLLFLPKKPKFKNHFQLTLLIVIYNNFFLKFQGTRLRFYFV